MMALSRAFTSIALGVSIVGCLPVDTRPEPSLVLVTADLPPDLVDHAFSTEDGYNVTLTRLFVSMGNLGFDGAGCNSYSEARYGRVLDMLQPGPQKLGQLWGLNACLLGYRVSVPREDAVLGASVTEADRLLMSNATVPTSSADGLATARGMTVHLQGLIQNGAVTVSFDWGFSEELSWSECKRRVQGELETQLPLAGAGTIDVNISVDPRNLFRVKLPTSDATDDSEQFMSLARLIVDADQSSGDANGRVAIDELIVVSVPAATDGENLAETIRKLSYPTMFRYSEDGDCVRNTKRGHGSGAGRGM